MVNNVNNNLAQFAQLAIHHPNQELTGDLTTNSLSVKQVSWQGKVVAFLQNIPLLNRLLPVTKPDTTAQSVLLKNIAVKYGEKVADKVNTLYKVDVKTTPLKGYQVTDLLRHAGRIHNKNTENRLRALTPLYPPAASTIKQATQEWHADTNLQKTVPEEEYVAVKVYADPAHREEINTQYLANDEKASALVWKAMDGLLKLKLDKEDPHSSNKFAVPGLVKEISFDEEILTLKEIAWKEVGGKWIEVVEPAAEKVFYDENLAKVHQALEEIVNTHAAERSRLAESILSKLSEPINQADATVDTQPNKAIPADRTSLGTDFA
jgi:hypothetical protein